MSVGAVLMTAHKDRLLCTPCTITVPPHDQRQRKTVSPEKQQTRFDTETPAPSAAGSSHGASPVAAGLTSPKFCR